MALSTQCPACQRPVVVPEALREQPVRCTACFTTFLPGGGIVDLPKPPAPAPEEKRETQVGPVPAIDGATPGDANDTGAAPPPLETHYIRRDVVPHRGNILLAFGILSIVSVAGLVTCTLLSLFGLGAGITVWVMANKDLRRMAAGEMDPDGRQTTNTARICAIIGLCLNVLSLLACGGFMLYVFLMPQLMR